MSNPSVYVAEVVQKILDLHKDIFDETFPNLAIREQLERQANRIVEAHSSGNDAVVAHITCWHPTMCCWKADRIMAAKINLADARETLAREYGFADWAEVEKKGNNPPSQEFEIAVDNLLSGDVEALREALDSNPDLICQKSDYGHAATLVHYLGSNGVETHRQVVPLNVVEIAKLLIERGADLNAVAKMYGGSHTLGLVGTSGHPFEAGVAEELTKVLREAGAEA
jgi:hypothetical protein